MRTAFNSDFYVTAATVIPVLYLALGVQGSLLAGVIAGLNKYLRAMSQLRPNSIRRQVGLVIRLVGAYVLMIAAGLIVGAGVAGEIAALLTLYHQSGTPVTGRLVLYSLIALLAFTAASPGWALVVAWPRLQWIPLKHAWWIITHIRGNASPGKPDFIRRAAAADLRSVQAIIRATYKYSNRMDQPPASLLRDYSTAVEAGDGELWVAGDPVVGLIVLTQVGDSLHIDNIAVHPSAQGTGIGRQLIEFAEQQAETRGLRRLTLYTNEARTENTAIYTHLGYREVYRRTENRYRRVYMEKILPPRR